MAWFGGCIAIFLALYPPFYIQVFPSFFQALSRLNFRWPDLFFLHLGYELIALLLNAIIGLLFLRLFVRLPHLLEWITGIFLGIGLSTFVLEGFAIFFLLNRFTILSTYLGLVVIFLLIKKKWGWSECTPEFNSEPLQERWQFWFYGTAFIILTIIVLLNIYHSIFFPVTYWDALIYYIHYGEMTYKQGGFPVLVCLQVGLGLGANYPHLYALHQASTATLFGQWADLYGQLLMPVAGLASLVVLYYLLLHFFKNRLIAILSILVFRCVPYVTSYFIWASDYALVMVYTSIFLIFMACYLERRSLRSLQPLLCVAAIFPHINYLGWIVWPVLVVAILLAHFFGRNINKISIAKLLLMLLIWGVLASTWNLRNEIVTGNPVYAFFPEIFGGKNINMDVLASCNQEWLYHGYGAKSLGTTLFEKVLNSLRDFLVGWHFAPALLGILIPSFFFGWTQKWKFFGALTVLLFLYFIYQFIISGLYWYHTIAVIPILSLFVGRFLSVISNRIIFLLFALFILISGIVPGISYSIMGSKHANPQLPYFAHPGMEPETFYRYEYPEEASVWKYINHNLEKGAIILTHDNRYHVFRDDLEIIHLDDCGLTHLYGQPYPQNHDYLLKQGIHYYLRIGNHEQSHPILKQLGHNAYLNNPTYFKKVMESDSVSLYKLIK